VKNIKTKYAIHQLGKTFRRGFLGALIEVVIA
jgi:hypothetical protein